MIHHTFIQLLIESGCIISSYIHCKNQPITEIFNTLEDDAGHKIKSAFSIFVTNALYQVKVVITKYKLVSYLLNALNPS